MAKKVYIDFELRYKEAVKNLDEMQKEYSKLEKQVDKTSDSQKELGGILNKVTGGAITKFKGLKSSLGNAIKGFKGLRVAIIATGIGALVVAIGSLTAAFKQSEEGQEKMQRIMAALGAITKQVIDAFADFGEAIIDAVTNPMESIKSLGKGIISFISDPIGTVKRGFNDAKEAVTGFVEETISEVKAIDEVTKARQKAHHIERDLIVERAEANRTVNDIRLEAEKRDKYTSTERVAMLKKAQAIEEAITQKEIEAKKLLVEAQEKEMAQGKNTIEAKDKLAQLQSELINLDTKKLRAQRLLQTQITTAQNQEKAAKQADIDAKQKELDAEATDEQKRLDDIKAIQDAHAEKVKEEKAVKESEKIQLEKEKKIAELEELEATEEQKANIILFYNNKITKAKSKEEDNELKRQKIVEKTKINMAKQTFMNIASALGENSKAGKAFAAAASLINTYQGITAELATKTATPFEFVLKLANIASTAAIGFKSVKDILKTNPKSTSATPSSPISIQGAAIPQVPAFNIVGAGISNQIADVLAGQGQQPIQAYVVSNDVSTAQELDRNIITGASIG